jgi:hypothetical protein
MGMTNTFIFYEGTHGDRVVDVYGDILKISQTVSNCLMTVVLLKLFVEY